MLSRPEEFILFPQANFEFLTGKTQNHAAGSLEEVVENLSELSHSESLPEMLGQPYNCPRDVFELMLECWSKHGDDRPDFQVC